MATTRSLGLLTLDLVARVGGFVDGLTKAERESKKRMDRIKKDAEAVGKAFGLAFAGSVTSIAAMTASVVSSANEIRDLSRLANSSTEAFQRMAVGADKYGIEQDKLSDILKDGQERIGDYLDQGGGELADFFETIAPQIGVTAEQFRKLSGPQALQLYVQSLEKAKLSQPQMTKYMEQFASDATALIPLLQDNGKEMNQLADEAEMFGLILSDKTIREAEEFSGGLDTLGRFAKGAGTQIAAELLPELAELTDELTDPETVKAAADMAKGIAGAFADIVRAARETVKFVQWLGEEIAATFHGVSALDVPRLQDEIKEGQELLDSWNPLKRMRLFAKGELFQYYTDDEIKAEIEQMQGAVERVLNGAFMPPSQRSPEPPGVTIPGDAPPSLSGQPPSEPPKRTGKTGGGSARETDSLTDSITRQIEALEFQIATFGMAEDAVERYRLEQAGADDVQLAYYDNLMSVISGQEQELKKSQDRATEQKRLNSLYEEHIELITGIDGRTSQYNDTLSELAELQAAGLLTQGEYTESIMRAAEMFDQAGIKALGFEDIAGNAAQSLQQHFADFLFDPFDDGLEGMVEGFADSLQRMMAEAAAAQLIGAMFGGSSGGAGMGTGNVWADALGGLFSGLFGGGRATGGPVSADSFYEVGESNTPELLSVGNRQYLIPGNDGRVEPMRGGMSQNSGGNVYMTVNTPNADSFRASDRQLMRSVQRRMRS